MWARSAVRDGSITSTDNNAFVAASMLHEESISEIAPAFSAGGSATAPAGTEPAVWSSRNGSRAASAQQDLETQYLESEITAMGLQILQTEREVEEVQEAFAGGGGYRGRTGEALAAVEERLVRREQQLREKEKLLREEKVVLLRSRGGVGTSSHRVASAEGVKVVGLGCFGACLLWSWLRRLLWRLLALELASPLAMVCALRLACLLCSFFLRFWFALLLACLLCCSLALLPAGFLVGLSLFRGLRACFVACWAACLTSRFSTRPLNETCGDERPTSHEYRCAFSSLCFHFFSCIFSR
eukprot:jgi/Undpi1/7044/HiC_scaffold_21.g09518.m1